MAETVTAYDINQQPHQVPIESLVRRDSVYGILIVNNKILLSFQPEAGLWGLPGSGLDKDESDIDTIIREFREETGYTDLDVLDPAGEGQSYFTYADINYDSHQRIYVVRLKSDARGEITDPADSSKAELHGLNTIDLNTVVPIFHEIIKKFQNQEY